MQRMGVNVEELKLANLSDVGLLDLIGGLRKLTKRKDITYTPTEGA